MSAVEGNAVTRRPLLAAAIIGGVVTLAGFGAAFIPDFGLSLPLALALALGYGVFLGGLVTGLVLADSRLTRWLWAGAILLAGCFLGLGVGISLWPAAVVRQWWFINLTFWLIVAWLLAGCLLAVSGWWSYARRALRR